MIDYQISPVRGHWLRVGISVRRSYNIAVFVSLICIIYMLNVRVTESDRTR